MPAAHARARQAPFTPQQLTVKPAIDLGPNVFTNRLVENAISSIDVFSATDLSYKGSMSAGIFSQMLIAPNGKTAYATSLFMKRIVYGEAETVLQIFDVARLSVVKEVALPPRAAMSTAYQPLLAQSADGEYVYVQNATPATSVTVVDVHAGQVMGEIPVPGCWGIYPSLQGKRFSTICGDGSFATFTLGGDVASTRRTQSDKIFDVETDPLFISGQRVGEDLVFVSYHGNVYRLSDTGAAVRLTERFSVTEGINGGWAPGGYGLTAYNKAHNVLFIGMHPQAKDGSHKEGAMEIWAIELGNRRLQYRSPVDSIVSMTVTDDAVPVLYGVKLAGAKSAVIRFDVDPDARFALKKSHQADDIGFSTVVAVRP